MKKYFSGKCYNITMYEIISSNSDNNFRICLKSIVLHESFEKLLGARSPR